MANDLSGLRIEMSFKGQSYSLRPSLRCAASLVRLHDGLPNLIKKISEWDTATVRAVITHATPEGVGRLLKDAENAPLSVFMRECQPALFELLAALIPENDAAKGDNFTVNLTWEEAFEDLFAIGTGWLGWSPAETWDATPSEIMTAFSAHADKLKAIHGGGEDDDNAAHENSEDQRQANIDAGLDPDFDRAGLVALKHLQRRMR